jgi:citronellol/citronellal dehydrogenase
MVMDLFFRGHRGAVEVSKRFSEFEESKKQMRLGGKTAIVTGASRGLGKAMAIELANAGASVAVAARTTQAGQNRLPGTIHETAKEIERRGGKAMAVRCDVTKEPDVLHLVEQVNEAYGPVDILINNAGIATFESFMELPVKKWELLMQVNLRGTFLCTKAVLPQMTQRRKGNIINLSSVLAKAIKYNIAYGVTKAAIERLTLGLAEEMRIYNIAVNALCPDFTVTEAVKIFRPETDTSSWQLPEMWGKYAVMVAAQEAGTLTGRILDESTLREIFGAV